MGKIEHAKNNSKKLIIIKEKLTLKCIILNYVSPYNNYELMY